MADINVEGVQETISLIQAQGKDVQTLAIEVNVADATSVRNMVSKTVESFGRLDYGMFLKLPAE